MSKIVGVTVGTPLSLSRIKREIEPVIVDHEQNKENPHEVTAKQVGLGNVDNTSDMDKPVSTAQAEAINTAKNEAIGKVNNLFVVSDTVPVGVPALWFNIAHGGAVNNLAMMSLEDDESGYDVQAVVGDEIYGVNDSTVNQQSISGGYDFTVI